MNTSKNKNHLICFDLDGILIHSMTIANEIFFDTVEEELGLPTEEVRKNKKMMSLSGEERFNLFWRDEIREKGITKGQLKEVIEKYRVKKLAARIPVLPGAVEAVKLMAEYFENIAAVSSNTDYIIEATLKELNVRSCFKKLTGLDHVSFAKPNPEMYASTVEYFNVAPENAMTFEDSANGIASAKGAGMKVIAVATGLESYEELKETPADLVLNNLTELKLDMVLGLFNISNNNS